MYPGIPQTKPINIKTIDPEKQVERKPPGWEWYDPPQDSPPVKFCLDTSLHGLRYLGQQKRHLCERIFWLTAFITAVTTAAIWIWQMYHAYTTMPIITVFSPSELSLNQIPFPAVTICNVNNIQKSKVDELRSKAMKGLEGNLPENEYLQALANYLDIWHICGATKTFTERFAEIETFGSTILKAMWENRHRYGTFLDPVQTLRNFSQSCSDMIIFCLWLDNKDNCSSLFQEVETDYGYCCTFNTIPLTLLRRYEDKYAEMIDDPERVEAWREADVNMDNLIIRDGNKAESRRYPRRQKYPGRGAGLSILLDPDLDEYYCSNTDSEGFMVSVNVPLDFPRIKENGIAVRTNSEVFINVKPEVTVSEDSTKHFSLEKRKCYFDKEYELPRYTKYTTSNCVDECIATETNKKCGCMRYFMPHGEADEAMCRPSKYNCTEEVKEEMVANGLEMSCKHCLATCTEILYRMETTSLPIRKQYTTRLFEKFPEVSKARNVSIVHLYYSVDSTYPRLRKEMMSIIELISNAGGLLGLCMGFSMLSMLEIIYHATLRLFCRSYRKRSQNSRSNHGDNVSRQNWASGMDYNSNSSDSGMQEFKYSSNDRNINTGFLRKVFQRNYITNTRTDEFTGRDSADTLPEYFQTPFEADFYKAYLATAAFQSPPLVDVDGKVKMYPIFDKTIKTLPQTKHTVPSSEEQYFSADEDDETSSWVWYDPPEDSAPVKFCMDTSLHGLRYLGQRNRHICERLFWLTAFITAVAAAVALIWHMVQSYVNMPIVTVFNPSEVTLDSIPFPSVTICNANNIQRSKFDYLTQKYRDGVNGNISDYELTKILARFLDIYHICQSARTFTERFIPIPRFEYGIYENMMNRTDELKPFLNPKETLEIFSQSCENMILFCVWNDAIYNCSKLFQKVETDYGYCCSFNMMPVPLLLKSRDEFSRKTEINLTVFEEWRKANLTTENLVSDVNRTRPYKQLYPGRSAGLSILLDPDLEEVYCTNSDSQGFMVGINTPLDFPRIKDNGLAVNIDSEVFIGVKPEITMSDESTAQFKLEKRKCYYAGEKKLPTYSIYTTSNCLDECIAWRVRHNCSCLRYYMPGYGNDNQTLCKPEQYKCTERVREEVIRKGLAGSCWNCLPSCSEITYSTETTSLKIRKSYTDRLFQNFPEHSSAQNVSIVHVYFNVDSTYPRLRKEMSTMIDLISSAGGLLGLCMGFSMLSLLEIIYHSTIRLFWNYYRERANLQKKEHKITIYPSGKERNETFDYVGNNDTHNITYLTRKTNSNGFMEKVFQRFVPKKVNEHVRQNSSADQIFQTNQGKLATHLPEYYQTNFATKFQGDFVDSLGKLKVDVKQN